MFLFLDASQKNLFFGDILNTRGLFLALGLSGLVLLFGYLYKKNHRDKRHKPGQYLLYEAPGLTAADCLGLLNRHSDGDMFQYQLQNTPQGGLYITFLLHNPTEQVLDTVFLLQTEGDHPARFSLTFVREAFGTPEPVLPEALLDSFFLEKLGAHRISIP